MKNLYEVLGVPPDATEDAIKKRYRKLALELHPDHNGGDKNKTLRFKEVSTAYAILGEKAKRAEYDRQVGGGRRQGIFGEDFDDLVGRVKTEGVKADNIDALFSDLFSITRDINEKMKQRTASPPPGHTGINLKDFIQELFGDDLDLKKGPEPVYPWDPPKKRQP